MPIKFRRDFSSLYFLDSTCASLIVGAKANGVCGVGVLWGYGTRDELEASGAHACIRHPKELSTISDD
jgi:hypothetical protein